MTVINDNLDVWVLAGQSNMQGCGALAGALEPDDRVYCHNSAGNWEVACEPLHRLWESFTPINQQLIRPIFPEFQDRTNEDLAREENEVRFSGSGLGISFGKTMAVATGKKIGLIAAAHGGTSLEQWNPNKKSMGGNSLYGAMLERIELAGGNLRGILWYQGESDMGEADAPTYKERMISWIEAARADVGIPDLPVIMVQLGRYVEVDQSGAHGWDLVKEALRTIPETCPNTATVAAIDLGLADAIHIDTPGLIRLGRRMALAALRLEKGDVPSPNVVKIVPGVPDQPIVAALKVVCKGITGNWNPQHHIGGFQVYDAQGKLFDTIRVISADRDKSDPQCIRVLLNGALPETDIYLGYGLGLDPYANAVDDADMSLSAFMPKKLESD